MNNPFTLIAIAAALIAFLLAAAAHGQSLVVQYGNLVYRNASGATEVLTETGADGSPTISPDGNLVGFTRLQQGERENKEIAGSGPLRDVYVIRISDLRTSYLASTHLRFRRARRSISTRQRGRHPKRFMPFRFKAVASGLLQTAIASRLSSTVNTRAT